MANFSTEREYFDKLYESAIDPFRLWQSEFERSKRGHALGLLQNPHYGEILEPGCGNGAFSLDLAEICDHLTSVDWSDDALKAAALHCAGLPNIEFCEMDFPNSLPNRKFDLMIVSELLYYFSEEKLLDFFHSMPKVVKPGGEILLVHWRGKSMDYPTDGDFVHGEFHKQRSIQLVETFDHPQYLVSVGLFRGN